MKRLLIADNQKNLLLLYRLEFEKDGYLVDIVQDPNEIPSMLERNHYDLLILEIKMLETGWIETLSEFLGDNNKLPVIINIASYNCRDISMSRPLDSNVLKSSDLNELKKK